MAISGRKGYFPPILWSFCSPNISVTISIITNKHNEAMPSFSALSCPQCGGTLPEQAKWRRVTCPFCQASVTRNPSLVERKHFQSALAKHQQQLIAHCAPEPVPYKKLGLLAHGADTEIWLGERLSIYPERVIIKIAKSAAAETHLHEEALKLQQLQSLADPFFSRLLPHFIEISPVFSRACLILRAPQGYWGSLANVLPHYPHGLPAEHTVWIWRRILNILSFLEKKGFAHGALSPDHLLVHPRDHGIHLIAWRRLHEAPIGHDIWQSAWLIRQLLAPTEDSIPQLPATLHPALSSLLEEASDLQWCQSHTTADIDLKLRSAAKLAFGPPRFIHFSPTNIPQPTFSQPHPQQH